MPALETALHARKCAQDFVENGFWEAFIYDSDSWEPIEDQMYTFADSAFPWGLDLREIRETELWISVWRSELYTRRPR